MSKRRIVGGVDFTEVMTPAEVAKAFGVDPKTVTRYADAGSLACVRTPGIHPDHPGQRRYSRAQVDQMLADSFEGNSHRKDGDPLAMLGELLDGKTTVTIGADDKGLVYVAVDGWDVAIHVHGATPEAAIRAAYEEARS